jgi:hypothetical protein
MMERARRAVRATVLIAIAMLVAGILSRGDVRIVLAVGFGSWGVFAIIDRVSVHSARKRLQQQGLLDEKGRWKGDPKYKKFLEARHKPPPNEKP